MDSQCLLKSVLKIVRVLEVTVLVWIETHVLCVPCHRVCIQKEVQPTNRNYFVVLPHVSQQIEQRTGFVTHKPTIITIQQFIYPLIKPHQLSYVVLYCAMNFFVSCLAIYF